MQPKYLVLSAVYIFLHCYSLESSSQLLLNSSELLNYYFLIRGPIKSLLLALCRYKMREKDFYTYELGTSVGF